jgi:YbbR domain-containing protein
MLKTLRTVLRYLPTFVLAFILALAVWISAVTAADPTVENTFPRAVPLQVVGQDPSLLLTSDIPDSVVVRLSAPNSVWTQLSDQQMPLQAVVDLSGLDAGTHEVDVEVSIEMRPVVITNYTPDTVTVILEAIASQSFPIRLVQTGQLSVGFQAETPALSQRTATVTGPESLVAQVVEVQALLSLERAQENIDELVDLVALDENGNPVNGVTISPSQVNVSMGVFQRGGYRNVVVKVSISGQVASGYRVTNISVFPPAVTVFSENPQSVLDLPGYVETIPLDLSGARDDLDVNLPLDLPPGVTIVGQDGAEQAQLVEVQVSIAAIEGSLTLEGKQVEVVGLEEGLRAEVSPETVVVIISGPLPLLDLLTSQDVRVVVDMAGEGVGTYQQTPQVVIDGTDFQVESILPSTVEVNLMNVSRFDTRTTPTPTATAAEGTSTPNLTVTVTATGTTP